MLNKSAVWGKISLMFQIIRNKKSFYILTPGFSPIFVWGLFLIFVLCAISACCLFIFEGKD